MRAGEFGWVVSLAERDTAQLKKSLAAFYKQLVSTLHAWHLLPSIFLSSSSSKGGKDDDPLELADAIMRLVHNTSCDNCLIWAKSDAVRAYLICQLLLSTCTLVEWQK